jgi:hypothetical protein
VKTEQTSTVYKTLLGEYWQGLIYKQHALQMQPSKRASVRWTEGDKGNFNAIVRASRYWTRQKRNATFWTTIYVHPTQQVDSCVPYDRFFLFRNLILFATYTSTFRKLRINVYSGM